LAEDEESCVGFEGGFVVAVQARAVVDPAVGGFDDPSARLHDEPAAGFEPRHDVDGDAGLGGGVSDSGSGVTVVRPEVGGGWCDAFGLWQQCWSRGPVGVGGCWDAHR
jgi:hypothetical protein